MGIRRLIWSTLLMFTLVGCATTHNLERLSLNMTKDDVRQTVGGPTAVRGSLKNKYGEIVEVWEYELTNRNFFQRFADAEAQLGGLPSAGYGSAAYWLYFVDDRLVQWGQAGDWAKEADRIYEVRFGSSGVLTSPQ